MSTNKDLLKQAIAEAKTIREAAITNAKEALEESLTPHLKEMLAQKLQEMEEEDNMEEIVNEEDMMNDPVSEMDNFSIYSHYRAIQLRAPLRGGYCFKKSKSY